MDGEKHYAILCNKCYIWLFCELFIGRVTGTFDKTPCSHHLLFKITKLYWVVLLNVIIHIWKQFCTMHLYYGIK